MSQQEQIAEMAKRAATLVENLDSLRKEAGSYRESREELNKTAEILRGLISETQNLSQETHKILATLDQIGAGHIFDKLGVLTSETKNQSEETHKILATLNQIVAGDMFVKLEVLRKKQVLFFAVSLTGLFAVLVVQVLHMVLWK